MPSFGEWETKNYTICINEDMTYGSFEHLVYGEDAGGGLWFNKDGVLEDYEGVFSLDPEIIESLKENGYDTYLMED